MGGAPGSMTNKQVESCFLNHNSSINFCCTDSLLMTHRCVSLFGELEEGAKFPFALGFKTSLLTSIPQLIIDPHIIEQEWLTLNFRLKIIMLV